MKFIRILFAFPFLTIIFYVDSLLVSGRERKYLCYKLIESIILPSMELEEVGVVFSPKLIKQVETNAAAKQHLLHDAAIHLVSQCLITLIIPGQRS